MSPREAEDMARQLSEARFRRIFEDSPISLQLIARDGRTLRVNRAWAVLMGISEDVLEPYLYKTYNIFEDPYLQAHGITDLIRRAFAGESFALPPVYYDPAEIGRPGRARWIEAYLYPIKSAEGVVDEVVLMHDDVTEKRHAESTLRFLSETSIALLGTALDYDATLKRGAELAMRRFGGWCAIHMLDGTQIHLAAVAHLERDKADQLTRLWQDVRRLEELGYGPVRVVRTGEPELRREFADILKSKKRQPAAEDALLELAGVVMKSFLSVPLRQRGEVIGALTILSADRFYSSEDLALAQEFADRAALALQNARLYEQSQRAITTHKLLAETMLQGVIRRDAKGTIIFMNPAAERILGKTHEEVLGSNPLSEEHHTIREDGSPFPGTDHPSMVALRTGQPVRDLVMGVFNARVSAYRWIRVDAVPLFRPGEAHPYEVYSVFADITESKRAEEAIREKEARLACIHAAVTEDIPSFLLAVEDDGDYRFESVNQVFSKTTGLPLEAIVGRRVGEVIPEPSLTLVRDRYREAITTRKPVRWQETTTYPTGRLVGEVAVTPLVDPDSHVRHLVGAVHDITDRRRAEEALREANEQLREADRRKNEFLAMLSHELRNPLAPIRNSTYILERAAPGGDQAKRALAVIDRQAGQLAHLVDDLLDVTRITRNKIHLRRQPLELNELVRRTIEDQRSLFEKAEVHLELHPAPDPVLVSADWYRLAQVVGNLLQNAAKFTGRGGTTCVTIHADTAASRAVIQVEDTGVGMAPEILSRLFEPFAQADSSLDRSRGGLGLGLALVKGLVELHGGDVAAHSGGLGKGAEFVVRLPLAMSEAAAPQLQEGATRRRRRVLVIEDSIDAADTLREVLEFGEHEIEVAYNGPQGLAKARAFRPDVVLCDIGLPGMDGYAVARAFRADDALKRMHLVAVSGYDLPGELQRAAEAGFERHLAKPTTLEKLEQALASLPAPRTLP